MKKILAILLLTGCGAPTPEENRAYEYLESFKEDCLAVYGNMCNEVRLEVMIAQEPISCWTENGSIKRGLGLTEDLIKSNNKIEVYRAMLNCTVFATENTVNFVEFTQKIKGD